LIDKRIKKDADLRRFRYRLSTLPIVKRSYGQYCAVAKALDVVGSRWTMLVVRELLGGPRRFGDLMEGLPGIGTNLLSERLRELQDAEVILQRTLPPPAGSTVYELTERGRMLGGVALALAWWGYELLGTPKKGDEFRAHWFMVVGQAAFNPRSAGDQRLVCEMRTSENDVSHFRIEDGQFKIFQGPATDPDLTLSGAPHDFIELFTGQVGPRAAIANGMTLDGDLKTLERVVELFGLRNLASVS
jgi:DNA-binding HxlR family transcriptional regulator